MKLEDFLRPTQDELFSILCKMYSKGTLYQKNGFILVPGNAPIMLVAHLDTIHKHRVKQICMTENGNILMSPQGIGGDDRCGVYALAKVHELSFPKPWLLFTCNEEIGGLGALAFCKQFRANKLPKGLKKIKCIIELDRKGKNDAVYYNCANDEFEAYITSKGFKTDFGTFSDIYEIAPALGVAAVNLSSGYYYAHTQHEFINRKHLDNTIDKVREIVADSAEADFPTYEYVDVPHDESYGFYDGYDDYGHQISGFYGHVAHADMPGIENVPVSIRGAYVSLSGCYSFEKLEKIRKSWGESGILSLYECEFGVPYKTNMDKWEEQNK